MKQVKHTIYSVISKFRTLYINKYLQQIAILFRKLNYNKFRRGKTE